MSVTLGFIGAGNIGNAHMENAHKLGVPLLGVADIKPDAAQAAQKKFAVEKTYTDHRDMLQDKRITAVVVGTPNRFHAEHAIAALQAGKHVLLEKPMAMNVAEADAIIDAQKKSGKTVLIGMSNRFRASVKTLKKFMDAGRCGHIYSGQAFWYRRRGIPGFGGWFTTRSEAGSGELMDIGVHLLDVAMHLMSFPKPVAVSGATYNIWQKLEDYTYTSMWGKPTPGGRKDVEDYALATIRFDDGATLQLNVSWAINMASPGEESGVRLIGDKAGAALNGMDNLTIYGEEAGHITDTKPQFSPTVLHLEEMRHFIQCAAGEAEPLATAQEGRTVQSILDAIARSSAEGREVRLDR